MAVKQGVFCGYKCIIAIRFASNLIGKFVPEGDARAFTSNQDICQKRKHLPSLRTHSTREARGAGPGAQRRGNLITHP